MNKPSSISNISFSYSLEYYLQAIWLAAVVLLYGLALVGEDLLKWAWLVQIGLCCAQAASAAVHGLVFESSWHKKYFNKLLLYWIGVAVFILPACFIGGYLALALFFIILPLLLALQYIHYLDAPPTYSPRNYLEEENILDRPLL